MSALSESLPLPRQGGWRFAGGLTLGMLAILAGMYWPTLRTMSELWDSSETYTHGYLVFPISAWLIWRIRDELARIQLRPDLRALVVLAGAGAGWLLADAGSVNVVAQYTFIAMLIATVWTMLGWAFVWAAFFPLMFLFLAVPVGEFLIQPLMGVTADLTVALLQFTGIPVYREGTFFSVPSGDWSVVEACSGLRYLIASVTLGVLYAYLSYRSWKRRVLFSLAAAAVPIFANGGRAYMIVMIGHLSDMKLAVGIDHLIYGWIFFGIVMLLLFWIGSFWREDGRPESVAAKPFAAPAPSDTLRPVLTAAMLALATVAVWPAYSSWLGQRALPTVPDLQVEVPPGWRAREAFTSWVPHWVGADRQLRQSYTQAGHDVMLELDYYVSQRRGAKLINSQNYMARESDQMWSNVGENTVTLETAGEQRKVRQAKMRGRDGQRLLVWQWNLINRQPTVNNHMATLVLALDRVRLQRDDGLSVLIATPYEDVDIETAAATLARFAADMEPAIARTLDQADGP